MSSSAHTSLEQKNTSFLFQQRSAAYQVAVTVVTYNRLDITLRCLQALRQNTATSFFLTVVDNGSEPATQEALQRLQSDGLIDALVLHRRNMGVSVAANTGWQTTSCPLYIKVDNDILVNSTTWLDGLVRLCEEGEFAAVAYKLCSWHGTQSLALPSGLPYLGTEAFGGGCVLIPRRTHEALGFWNEEYVYGWEDLEYGNRIRLYGGSLAYLNPEGVITHLGEEDPTRRPDYQATKTSMAGKTTGPESLFLLNTAMFELGLRPTHVTRKFMPRLDKDGFVSYVPNPEYASILTRQKLFRERFITGYTEDGLSILSDSLK